MNCGNKKEALLKRGTIMIYRRPWKLDVSVCLLSGNTIQSKKGKETRKKMRRFIDRKSVI